MIWLRKAEKRPCPRHDHSEMIILIDYLEPYFGSSASDEDPVQS